MPSLRDHRGRAGVSAESTCATGRDDGAATPARDRRNRPRRSPGNGNARRHATSCGPRPPSRRGTTLRRVLDNAGTLPRVAPASDSTHSALHQQPDNVAWHTSSIDDSRTPASDPAELRSHATTQTRCAPLRLRIQRRVQKRGPREIELPASSSRRSAASNLASSSTTSVGRPHEMPTPGMGSDGDAPANATLKCRSRSSNVRFASPASSSRRRNRGRESAVGRGA